MGGVSAVPDSLGLTDLLGAADAFPFLVRPRMAFFRARGFRLRDALLPMGELKRLLLKLHGAPHCVWREPLSRVKMFAWPSPFFLIHRQAPCSSRPRRRMPPRSP